MQLAGHDAAHLPQPIHSSMSISARQPWTTRAAWRGQTFSQVPQATQFLGLTTAWRLDGISVLLFPVFRGMRGVANLRQPWPQCGISAGHLHNRSLPFFPVRKQHGRKEFMKHRGNEPRLRSNIYPLRGRIVPHCSGRDMEFPESAAHAVSCVFLSAVSRKLPCAGAGTAAGGGLCCRKSGPFPARVTSAVFPDPQLYSRREPVCMAHAATSLSAPGRAAWSWAGIIGNVPFPEKTVFCRPGSMSFSGMDL